MGPSKLPALSIPFNIAAVLMLLSMRSSAGLTGTLGPDTQQLSTGNDTLSNDKTEVEWTKVLQLFLMVMLAFVLLFLSYVGVYVSCGDT